MICLVVVLLLVAAVAIPWGGITCDVIPANEAAAGATLKSGLYPAEIRFQAEGIVEQDRDGVGEYGFIGELAGRRAAGARGPGEVRYLAGAFVRDDVHAGYRYAVYLPDGSGGALSEPAAEGPRTPGTAAAAQAQERWFVAYAWPAEAKAGRRMFAITESGAIRAVAWDGRAPAWNAVFGGRGWGAESVWPQYAR